MPRSRTLRALVAGSAGVVCSGSAICATLAYTHPSHKTVQVASLTAVPEVGAAARAAEPSAGLLAWRAPEMPRPLALPPRVVDGVRVVQTTRYIKVRAASPAGATGSTGTAATPRTTAAKHVATPRQATPTTKRTTWPTTTPATTTTTATTRTDDRSTRDGARETTDPQHREADRASRPTSTTTTEPRPEEPRRGDDG